MSQNIVAPVLANAASIVGAFAGNPEAVNQFTIFVCIIFLFALAWRGRR